jgi:hypothetical protein
MAKGILCNEGLRLELVEVGSQAHIAISWDGEPDHQITSDVAPASLFAVLNGMQYSICADPWTCILKLQGREVAIAINVDDFEILACGFSRDDYEDTLLTTFRTLRQAYRA